MKSAEHIDHLLHDYLDGALDADGVRDVEAHLEGCASCRGELGELRVLLRRLHTLPRSATPPRDLWEGIEARMATAASEAYPSPDPAVDPEPVERAARPPKEPSRLFRRRVPARTLVVAAAVVLIAGAMMLQWRNSSRGWQVAALEGNPYVGEARLERTRTLRVGDWLETDATSRARVEVGDIGYVEVAPETRLQLRNVQPEDHRIALAHGRIHARIWAPPRLFYVETPSATAIDLGCEYTLEVDDTGGSVLHVLSGYVGMEYGTRESVVPAGWMAVTRRGHLPGTPYAEDALPALREALSRFDFEGGHERDLATILAEARPADALTLWTLISRVPRSQKGRVYDRLTELVAPPSGVTRSGVLQADVEMRRAWREKLGVDVLSWWGAQKLKRKNKQAGAR